MEKNISGKHNSTSANCSCMQSQNVNNTVSCYGCGNPEYIKAKSPKCSLKKESASINAVPMFTCVTSLVILLDIEVYEATGTVCAGTGANQSVGGELMFKFSKNRGQKFTELLSFYESG
ncbi:retrovirus-related Pol polyprotein from transposon 412 [Nephila pilipes]|uniref:Retrovirus-related Pol polyprotein from transposon 412 n=1 Tax=Nephila pilipes TaxID=299642 RepID=A0A8X6Q6J9_NEPPI|nr:retrovirus-related Pol polyprotein from transposon 412 [Nephila pilipes]